MGGGEISFEIRNSLSELSTLAERVEEFGESIGLSSKCLFEVCLALEEVFTNIVSYGYEDDKEHWISVTIRCAAGMLTLRLEDDGIPFDPCRAEAPDLQCSLEERRVGGMGILLAKRLTKDMMYERCGTRNILTLKKDIQAGDAGDCG